jgi:hypothetical protein
VVRLIEEEEFKEKDGKGKMRRKRAKEREREILRSKQDPIRLRQPRRQTGSCEDSHEASPLLLNLRPIVLDEFKNLCFI